MQCGVAQRLIVAALVWGTTRSDGVALIQPSAHAQYRTPALEPALELAPEVGATARGVPRVLMQTGRYGGDRKDLSRQLSHLDEHIRQQKGAWLELNPGWTYLYLNDTEDEAFLLEMGPRYAAALRKLWPGAMTADLLRLA